VLASASRGRRARGTEGSRRDPLPGELRARQAAASCGQGQQRAEETTTSSGRTGCEPQFGSPGRWRLSLSLTGSSSSTPAPAAPCQFTCTAGTGKRTGTWARASPVWGTPGKGPGFSCQESNLISSVTAGQSFSTSFFPFFFSCWHLPLFVLFTFCGSEPPSQQLAPQLQGQTRCSPASCSWLPAHMCHSITIITVNEACLLWQVSEGAAPAPAIWKHPARRRSGAVVPWVLLLCAPTPMPRGGTRPPFPPLFNSPKSAASHRFCKFLFLLIQAICFISGPLSWLTLC